MDLFKKETVKLINARCQEIFIPLITKEYDIAKEELQKINIDTEDLDKLEISLLVELCSKPAKRTAKPLSVSNLKDKITKAKESNKYYNISTKRIAALTPANKKKYQFYEEFSIMGVESDPQLTEALSLLKEN